MTKYEINNYLNMDFSDERGSLVVATLLFMVLFLAIASLGIDASRHFAQSKKLQSVADNAALAGGRIFNRYSDSAPDTEPIHEAALNHITSHLGEDYPSTYPGDGDGVIVEAVNPPGTDPTCTDGFAINDGEIVLNQPATVKNEVLGSDLKYRGSDAPVTSQMEVTDKSGSTETFDPWGDYDDPNSGNLNVDGGIDPFSLPPQDAGSTITTRAQSYKWGRTHREVEQGDPQTRILSHGDDVPDVPGFGDQDAMATYVEDYVDDEGKIDIPKNEAIVFYELWAENDSVDYFDLQDLVLHITVNPNSGTGGDDSVENVSSSGSQSDPCNPYPEGTYRIGVVVYDDIQYHLWPDWFTKTEAQSRITRTAIAEVTPQQVHRNFPDPQCGLFADGIVEVLGNNLNAGSTNFCSNSGIVANGSNNGTMGNLYVPQGAGSILPPGGSHGEVARLPEERPVPNFSSNDPSDYMVDLNNFDDWTDNGSCGGGDETSKALRTGDGTEVVWSKGSGSVCITQDLAGDYKIDNNNGELMQTSGGDPVSIYADGSMTFSGNGNGIRGGLYAEGDVNVTANNYDFLGAPGLQGGLALWAEGSITFDKNNIRIEGITGSGGDYDFGSSGGGTGPVLEGVLATGGNFNMRSNSNSVTITHDPSKYNASFLSNDWSGSPQEELDKPLYSNVKVRLIR